MFAGTLKTFSVSNLMQMCYNDNNTGIIEFKKLSILYGRLGFINGSIIYAKFLDSEGIKAVRQLTLIQDLEFHFIPQVPKMKPNIKTDINFLLLDCSRYRDECVEYIDRVKSLFQTKYTIKKAGFYQFMNSQFAFPDLYRIKYFELYDQANMTVIYLDKNISARIELLFANRILTSELLMFMGDKDIIE